MNKHNQIKSILQHREITLTENDFALRVSNNRVAVVSQLNNQEADKLLQILKEFTPEKLIEGIYLLSFDLGHIFSIEICFTNDTLVLSWGKQVFDEATVKGINKAQRLTDLSYTSLYIMAETLGKLFLHRSALVN